MEDSQKGVLLDMVHSKHADGNVVLNISRSGYLTAPYEEKVVANPKDTSDRIAEKLQQSIHVMTSRVDQLQREVLQVTRIRSVLKRARVHAHRSLKDNEAGNSVNKKSRLFDAARTEAIKQKKMSGLFRLCGGILQKLMHHRWAWPFLQPVDVELLQLKDYYKVIRRPMDLGTIQKKLEMKDGSGYQYVREFCEDVCLVFRNAMLYNDSSSDVFNMAKTLSQKFEKKWKLRIEARLLEEEGKKEDQQDKFCLNVAVLHAQEEQAAMQLGENVITQLTGVEKKIHAFLMQVLPNCRPMKTEEKTKLYQRIHKLPPVSLTRVMDILPLENICGSTADIQIDLEALDSSTLWRLHFFVKMITEFTPEPAKKKLDNKGHACGESSMI